MLALVLLVTIPTLKLAAQTIPPGVKIFTNAARNISVLHPSANIGVEFAVSERIALSTDIGVYYYHYVLDEPTDGLSLAAEGRYFFRRKWWFGAGISGSKINYTSYDALVHEDGETGTSQSYSVNKGLLLAYGLFGYRKYVGKRFFFGPQLGLGLGFMDRKIVGRASPEDRSVPIDLNIKGVRGDEWDNIVPAVKPGFIFGYRFSK